MNFTESTITDFFRKIGQPAAGARLIDHLRTENLILARGPGIEASPKEVEQYVAGNVQAKKNNDRR